MACRVYKRYVKVPVNTHGENRRNVLIGRSITCFSWLRSRCLWRCSALGRPGLPHHDQKQRHKERT